MQSEVSQHFVKEQMEIHWVLVLNHWVLGLILLSFKNNMSLIFMERRPELEQLAFCTVLYSSATYCLLLVFQQHSMDSIRAQPCWPFAVLQTYTPERKQSVAGHWKAEQGTSWASPLVYKLCICSLEFQPLAVGSILEA